MPRLWGTGRSPAPAGGQKLGKSLLMGLKAGFFSGVVAGVTAGVYAGIKASKNGGDFWSGKRPEVNTVSTLEPKGIEPVGLPKPKGGDLSGLQSISFNENMIATIELDEVILNAGPSFRAVQEINSLALCSSVGECGKYIRYSLESGFNKQRDAFLGKSPNAAKDYGTFLQKNGYRNINTSTYLKGDIAVFNSNANHTWGHVQIYNGEQWVSDYFQNRFWPNNTYENANDYSIFRWFNLKR